jgi:antitoxin component YwqK of YwqJK toxin-antitoxin module
LWIEDDGCNEVYYRNGLKNGVFGAYDRKTGRIGCFGEYSYGKPVGTWYYFNEQSRMYMMEKNMRKNTHLTVARADGKRMKLPFKSYVLCFYPNGEVREEGLALHDGDVEIDSFKKGIWKYYDESGKPVRKKREDGWGG